MKREILASIATLIFIALPLASAAAQDSDPDLGKIVSQLSSQEFTEEARGVRALRAMLDHNAGADTSRFLPTLRFLRHLIGVGGPAREVSLDCEQIVILIGKPALPDVINWVKDKEFWSPGRFHAARILAEIDPESAARELPLLLDEPDMDRRAIVQIIGTLGKRAAGSADKIKPFLNDPDVGMRMHANGAMARITDEAHPYVEALAALALQPHLMEDGTHEAGEELWALGELGRPGFDILIAHFTDHDPVIRQTAVGQFDEGHDGWHPPGIVAELLKVLENDDDAAVRARAASALGCLGSAARSAAPAIARGLDKEDSHALMYAMALGDIQTDDAFEALMRAAKSRDEHIRGVAIGQLYRFQTHRPAIRAALRDLAKDPSESVRESAIQDSEIMDAMDAETRPSKNR